MERKLSKKVKEQKAITLIALIVTIVVLLILAGVAIAMLTGENGIIGKAQLAKEKQENAEIQENTMLEEYVNLIDDYEGNVSTPKALSAKDVYFTPIDTNWNVDNVKDALDYLYSN